MTKFEELYLVKSLPNRSLLLERFLYFKIDSSKDLDYNLEAFSKLVHENLNTREKVSEYKGMDTLTPEIIINYLKSKEELKSTKAKNNNF